MKPAVVAFSGKIGSGKSEVSSQLATRLGWRRASFGDYLRSLARNQGFPESREILQTLGESLVAKDIRQFCKDVLTDANWAPGQGLVVDGIRHTEAVAILREIVMPLPFLLILIELPDPLRQDRLLKKGLEVESLRRLELHSTESQINSVLPRVADLRIDGTRKPDELIEEIVEYLRLRAHSA